MIDLKATVDGDLIIDETGDLAIVYGDEEIAQEVLFRLKTTKGDWQLSPRTGCDLEVFIGQPLSEISLLAMENRIYEELTKDDLLVNPKINAVQTSTNEVLVVIEFGSIEEYERIVQISAGFDMRKGLVFARVSTYQS